jgi:hypothetical protein
MIAIVNIEPDGTPLNAVHEYELRINYVVICKFKHQRKDGLAACLKAAAAAAERADNAFVADNAKPSRENVLPSSDAASV